MSVSHRERSSRRRSKSPDVVFGGEVRGIYSEGESPGCKFPAFSQWHCRDGTVAVLW